MSKQKPLTTNINTYNNNNNNNNHHNISNKNTNMNINDDSNDLFKPSQNDLASALSLSASIIPDESPNKRPFNYIHTSTPICNSYSNMTQNKNKMDASEFGL